MDIIQDTEKGLSIQYEAFFNKASIGIILVNEQGEIILANPFLLQLFGYESEELFGKKIETLIPQRYHAQHPKDRTGYTQNPKSRPMGSGLDLFGIKKNGVEFPVEISLSSYYSETNEKFVIAFLSDNTKRYNDRNEIEQLNNDLENNVVNRTRELSRTLQVLELLNEKLENTLLSQKAILNTASVMLFAMNNEGIIQFFNPEASRLTGFSESEVVNKLTPVVFHQPLDIEKCRQEHSNDFHITASTDFDVIKHKSLLNQIKGLECKFVHKNGSVFPVSLTISTIRDKKNQLAGFMGVAIDISATKSYESNLIEALSKEKKLGELKTRFVSMASHEFRTPLSTILSSAYLIEKYSEESDQKKREKHLNRIISSVNNLINILNEFLSLGKIEEGKVALNLTEFNISKLILSLITDLHSLLKKGQRIEFNHSGNDIIYFDSSLLKNIVLNLLSNAIKFSHEDSKIIISTFADESEIKLVIKDHGIGISTEDQEHLMERFFRGSNALNIQGTGLGLHIVSKYVERIGGTLSYKSEIEKGTTFTINFNTFKPTDYENNIID